MTPSPPILISAMFGFALGMSGSLAAEPPPKPVAGLWAVAIDQPRTGCRWHGHVRLAQRGRRITGSGKAQPAGRNRRCRPLKGAIDGNVDGNHVRFGFATGELGTADFQGMLDIGGLAMEGRWRARSASGRWWAERAR